MTSIIQDRIPEYRIVLAKLLERMEVEHTYCLCAGHFFFGYWFLVSQGQLLNESDP